MPKQRHTPKLAVIADDIAGANDTGVQFSKSGLRTVVLTHPEKRINLTDRVDIIVININTRGAGEDVAYRRAREAARAAAEAGYEILYKKIDSTLRGNIGMELEAIMDELKVNSVIVAPAYPKNQRVTIGGYQLINQTPIERTDIANDPVCPVRESHVPTLIQSQSKRRVGYVCLSAVMKGIGSLRNQIDQQIKRGNEIIVIDAATNGDLKAIAYAVAGSRLQQLTCGCAGLAEELPEAFGFMPDISMPVVVIAGSTSEVTMKQVEYAKRVIDPFIVNLVVAEVLENRLKQEMDRVVKEIGRAIDQRKDVILRSVETRHDVDRTLDFGKTIGLGRSEIRSRICSCLGKIAALVVDRWKIGGIVLTGGDVAMSVCEVIGANRFEITDEIRPGIPVSRVVGGLRYGLRVVTKAGAIGEEDALVEAVTYLKRKRKSV